MRVRLLAITPPEGPVDAAVVDAWSLDAHAHDLAVLVRRPAVPLSRALVDPGLAALLDRVRALGVPLLGSCDPGDLEAVAAACAVGCAGVQLRGDPGAEAVAAARSAGARLVGASMHAPAPAILPPADWLCVAPVFAPRTQTPGRTKAAIGLSTLGAFCGRGVDVLALGGVTAETAPACAAAGATGFASIRSFFGPSAEVAHDVAAFRAALRRGPAPP
jgi:hypothetical protein